MIFVSVPGLREPELGDYLGDLTNEIDGDYIVEGVFPGPKNYAFITKKNKTVCKVKGFSLNYKADQMVNFEAMKNMILNELGQDFHLTVEQSVITRNKKNWNIDARNPNSY